LQKLYVIKKIKSSLILLPIESKIRSHIFQWIWPLQLPLLNKLFLLKTTIHNPYTISGNKMLSVFISPFKMSFVLHFSLKLQRHDVLLPGFGLPDRLSDRRRLRQPLGRWAGKAEGRVEGWACQDGRGNPHPETGKCFYFDKSVSFIGWQLTIVVELIHIANVRISLDCFCFNDVNLLIGLIYSLSNYLFTAWVTICPIIEYRVNEQVDSMSCF